MHFISIFILALAISLDGFAVGITYGLKGIKINLLPILIISFASGLTMFFSMSLGSLLTNFLSPVLAAEIGDWLLIIIGIWLFYQSLIEFLKEEESKEDSDNLDPKEIISLKIESLGLIISIFKEPIKADLDYSGTISNREALFLGVALALDAFGAGIAAAMAGYSSILTAMAVAGFKFCLLTLGIYLGKNIKTDLLGDRIKLVPGIILILLGVIKLL